MRTTGVNFARGSCCRALKWMAPMRMALFGVVFAVGAGSASAQLTISGTDDNTKVLEGNRAAFTIEIKYRQVGGAPARNVVVSSITAGISFRDPANLAAGALPIAAAQTDPPGNGNRDGTLGNLITEAEATDFTTAISAVTIVIPPNTSATTTNGTISRQAFVDTGSDADAEDEAVLVTFGAIAADSAIGQDGQAIALPTDATRELIIDDRQEQKFRWRNAPTDLKENGNATWQIEADPIGVNLEWVTSLFTDEAGYTFTNSRVGVGNPVSVDVVLNAPANDGNRVDDEVTVRAVMAGTRTDLPGLAPLTIEVEDIHTLPAAGDIEAKAYADNGRGSRTSNEANSVTEGGDPVHVRVTIDRGTDGYPSGEALTVRPVLGSSGHSADYRIEPASIEIATGTDEKFMDFKLWAEADNDVGAETLTLDLVTTGKTAANGAASAEGGTVTGSFSIDIENVTETLLEPKSDTAVTTAVNTNREAVVGADMLWTPGEDPIRIETDELFTSDGDVDMSASSSDEAVVRASVSGGVLALEPRSPGTATVTVRGTAVGGATSAIPQTEHDVAVVEFEVKVDQLPLVVTVAANPTEIAEGGVTTLTATANRDVTEDTTIALAVVPSGKLAGPDSIMIREGQRTGSATLTASHDDDFEDESVSVVATGAGISGSQTVAITVTDDDMALSVTLTASAASVAEGGTVTLTATANQDVSENTEVTLVRDAASTAGADDYSLDPVLITIMAGGRTGAATLTATDDADVEGNERLTLNALVDSVSVGGSVSLTVTDNDMETTYTLTSSAASVEEGGEVTLTVTANQAVRANTEVTLMRDAASAAGADDYRLSPERIVILDGESSVEVKLAATDDYSVEGVEELTLNALVGGLSVGSVTVTVIDNDVETTYSLSPTTAAVEEGGTVLLTVTANQAVRANTEVTLMRDAASTAGADDYSLDPVLITIMAGSRSGAATLTATDDAEVEGNERLTLNAQVGDVSAGSATITVTDNDMATTYRLTSSAASVEEGGMVTLTATANQAVREATVVRLMRDAASAAGADDFGLAPESITIEAGSRSGVATLTATDDREVEGDETLTLNALVGDLSVGSVTVTVTDNDMATTYRLTPSAASVEEGGTVTLTATANQAVSANTEVMVMRDAASAASDDDYRLVPALITILSGETSGEATLTATDDTEAEGDERLTLNAQVGGLSVGSVTVTVTDNDAEITYTLSGPVDMNVAEGQSAEVTATASRAVTADTMVELVATGGDAGAADYSAAPIVIGAGETTGTTLLMAVDDGLAERSEELTLEGRVGGMKTNALTFTIWDAAVPALPVIAQLLLAAFLAVGGYRRYLRRR